ncbi:MAG: hypothetical protein KBB33_01885 [Candidatus Cloacimonetes bacterium]|nr:hypothetical protein [Candidatus Cloacimonadota bacterium]
MKSFLLTLSLALCLCPIFAEAGLLGLDFSQGYAEAARNLQENGFACDASEPNNFLHSGDESIIDVSLTFSPEDSLLICWLITIPLGDMDDYELEADMLREISQLHGFEYEYDESSFEAFWKLDDLHYVTAAFDEELTTYYVFYGDVRYEDCVPY